MFLAIEEGYSLQQRWGRGVGSEGCVSAVGVTVSQPRGSTVLPWPRLCGGHAALEPSRAVCVPTGGRPLRHLNLITTNV